MKPKRRHRGKWQVCIVHVNHTECSAPMSKGKARSQLRRLRKKHEHVAMKRVK